MIPAIFIRFSRFAFSWLFRLFGQKSISLVLINCEPTRPARRPLPKAKLLFPLPHWIIKTQKNENYFRLFFSSPCLSSHNVGKKLKHTNSLATYIFGKRINRSRVETGAFIFISWMTIERRTLENTFQLHIRRSFNFTFAFASQNFFPRRKTFFIWPSRECHIERVLASYFVLGSRWKIPEITTRTSLFKIELFFARSYLGHLDSSFDIFFRLAIINNEIEQLLRFAFFSSPLFIHIVI